MIRERARSAAAILAGGFALAFLATTSSAASTKLTEHNKSYHEQVQKIEEKHGTALHTALTLHAKALDTAAKKAQTDGDLERLPALRKEKERFDDEKSMPAEVPSESPAGLADIQAGYYALIARAKQDKQEEMVALLEKHISALDSLKRQYVTESKTDEALEAKTEIQKGSFSITPSRKRKREK